MNYRKVYVSIIKKAKSEKRKKGNNFYYENHHILPRSLFPLWSDRFNSRNTVLLTAREHFFCHQLLNKIYPGEKMFLALWYLANDGQNKYCIKNSKEYERLKIIYSRIMSKRMMGNTYGFKKGQKFIGRVKTKEQIRKWRETRKERDNFKLSSETIEKIKKANIGKKRSEDSKKKMSISMKGKNIGNTNAKGKRSIESINNISKGRKNKKTGTRLGIKKGEKRLPIIGVLCKEDNLKFKNITEITKFYNISYNTVYLSIKNNLLVPKIGKSFSFIVQ